jgi:hypothetical protein
MLGSLILMMSHLQSYVCEAGVYIYGMVAMKKILFKKTGTGITRNGVVYPDGNAFQAVRFGLGQQKYTKCRTETSAINFMKRDGYTVVLEKPKKGMSSEQRKKIVQQNTLQRMEEWFRERSELFNIPAIAAAMKIHPGKMQSWLTGNPVEFTEKEYQKLKEVRDFIKGIKTKGIKQAGR